MSHILSADMALAPAPDGLWDLLEGVRAFLFVAIVLGMVVVAGSRNYHPCTMAAGEKQLALLGR